MTPFVEEGEEGRRSVREKVVVESKMKSRFESVESRIKGEWEGSAVLRRALPGKRRRERQKQRRCVDGCRWVGEMSW